MIHARKVMQTVFQRSSGIRNRSSLPEMPAYSEKYLGTGQWVNIRDVPTRVVTWGKRLDEPFDSKKEVVLFVTGNPGIAGFYSYFLASLHSMLDGSKPIYLIGE